MPKGSHRLSCELKRGFHEDFRSVLRRLEFQGVTRRFLGCHVSSEEISGASGRVPSGSKGFK